MSHCLARLNIRRCRNLNGLTTDCNLSIEVGSASSFRARHLATTSGGPETSTLHSLTVCDRGSHHILFDPVGHTVLDHNLQSDSLGSGIDTLSNLAKVLLHLILVINVTKVFQQWYIRVLSLERLVLFELKFIICDLGDLLIMFCLLPCSLQLFLPLVCLLLQTADLVVGFVDNILHGV